MLDEWIPQIEQVRREGAIVILKWDGERSERHCTVVISRLDTDYVWRKDADHLIPTLTEALAAYRAAYPIAWEE